MNSHLRLFSTIFFIFFMQLSKNHVFLTFYLDAVRCGQMRLDVVFSLNLLRSYCKYLNLVLRDISSKHYIERSFLLLVSFLRQFLTWLLSTNNYLRLKLLSAFFSLSKNQFFATYLPDTNLLDFTADYIHELSC